jgi:hypothetical protein
MDVKEEKKVLILTDGTIAELAGELAAALDCSDVLVKTADEFKGNDILPVDVFFLGCKEPSPASFVYLTDLLRHINLAGRSCGILSSSEKTANYLAGLLKDCEAALNPRPLFPGAGVKDWAQSVISGSF